MRQGYGQLIRDDGPTSHHTKRGTPTMGGAVIILGTLLGYFASHLITLSPATVSGLLVLFLMTRPRAWSASSTTTSRSPSSAASGCGPGPSCPGRWSSR